MRALPLVALASALAACSGPPPPPPPMPPPAPAPSPPAPLTAPRLGFAYVPGPSGLLVTAVAEDGPAARELTPGAVVRWVGSVDVTELAPAELGELFDRVVADGAPVRLERWPRSRRSEFDLTPGAVDEVALARAVMEMATADGRDVDPPVEAAVLHDAMLPAGYRVGLDGGALRVASERCTTTVPLDRLAVVRLTEGRFLRLAGWGTTTDCGSGPDGVPSAMFALETAEDGAAAAGAARRLLAWGRRQAATPPQAATGTLRGTVTTHDGAPAEGATVLVPALDRGKSSGTGGAYAIELPAGTHALRFGYFGLRAERTVTVAPGETVRLDVRLPAE